MALNLDAALRIVGKVSGLNEFKQLTDTLENVGAASKDSRSGLQQLSAESARLTQESAKTVGSVKAQSSALQELETRTRAGATELRRMGAETKGLGSAVGSLRGQSSGALDGLTSSAAKSLAGLQQLQRGLQPTDEALGNLRDQVLQLGASSKQTERSLAQQVEALKNLRSQAEVNGQLYNDLTRDMERLTAASKGMGEATLFGVESMKKAGAASYSNTQSIEQQIKSLARLQSTLAKGSEGYREIGKSIDALKQKQQGLDLNKGLNVVGGAVGTAASGTAGTLANIVKLRQQLAKTNTGRVVLVGEGLASAGLAGAAGSGVAAGIGGVAAGVNAAASSMDAFAAKAQALPALLRPLSSLLGEPASAAAARFAELGGNLAAAQAKLAALSGPFEAIGTAINTIGPEASAAAGAASLAIASVYGVLSRQADQAQAEAEAAFKGISDEAQATLERLSRIYDRLPGARREAQEQLIQANLTRLMQSEPGSVEARRAANAVAVGEREVAKITQEINDLLDQARQKQNAGAEALKRQVEAGREKVATAKEELSLAERVAQVQRQAAERRRQAAAADRAEQIRQGAAAAAAAQPRILALPAAGQTSAPGTGQAISGGARTSLDGIEIAGTRANVGAVMGGFSGEARAALNEQAAATDKTRESLSKLFIEIDKIEAASNGSVQSLQKQRAAWEALRVSVNPAAPAYEKARAKVQELDAQLQKLTVTQEKTSRRGIGREAVGGALGALATGGGAQAALGSLAGSLAFSGGAAGLAAGGAITAIGGAAALATRVGLEAESAQVRLKALTDQFGEYNQAQVATERIARTLRISQTEASDGFAQLYAALRPTGVTLKEIEDAFIGFTAAARVSGATSAEASAALLQLKQALGSGVLQGDELRSIREQAPLVGQAIAKEMGVTVGELKKLGSDGKITTDIVLKALATLKDENLGKLNQQFDTGAQAIKDFQVAAENLGKTLSRVFGPTTVALLRDVTRGLQDMTDVLGNLAGDKDAEARLKNKIQARNMAADEAGKRFGISGLWRQGERESFFQQRQQQILDKLEEERLVKKEEAAAKKAATRDQQREKDDAAGERQAARDRSAAAARERVAELLKEEVKIRQDAEKRLGEAAEQREQQLRDFRIDTIKRAQELERQMADQRLQIEREIDASRRKAAQYEQDIATERAIREQRAQGLSGDGLEAARRVNELFRQFEEQKIANQNTALDRQTALQRQLEEFKISIAEGVGKIQEAYARSVSAILQDAGEKLAALMQKGAENAAGILSNATPGGGGGGSNATIASIADTSLNANARAWLSVIRHAEGTAGPNGYRTMFGGGLFSDMSRHPDRVIRSGGYASAAAGAYQFMPDTWRGVGGGAMTPERQDRAALALALRRGVDLSTAPFTRQNVAKLAPEWASLPTMAGGSAYGQPFKQFNDLYRVFNRAAGQTVVPQAAAAAPAVAAGPGEQAVTRARQQANAEAGKLRQTVNAARTSANDTAFKGVLASIEADLTGITSEMDQQRRSSREKLEDEKRYGILLRDGVKPEVAQQRVELERIATHERERLGPIRDRLLAEMESNNLTDAQKLKLQEIVGVIDDRIQGQAASIAKTEEEIEATNRLKKAREDAEGRDVGKGLKDGVKSYLKEMGTLAEGVADVTSNALKGLEDQLVNFVTTGKANFKELAASILADMSRILIQQMVMKPLLKGVGALFGVPFANGGIMTSDGPVPLRKYAAGGVASSPQLALFGEGSMPEAYVPLPDGRRIPVAMKGGGGGGGTMVNVSVDASGSQVQGDAGRGEQLGRAVAQAVQNELIRQKRPGGLLAVA